MIVFALLFYAFYVFCVLAGLALLMMLFVIKWVIAVSIALAMCAVQAARGQPMHFQISYKPTAPRPQAFYSSRR